jgi:hypothetical protein
VPQAGSSSCCCWHCQSPCKVQSKVRSTCTVSSMSQAYSCWPGAHACLLLPLLPPAVAAVTDTEQVPIDNDDYCMYAARNSACLANVCAIPADKALPYESHIACCVYFCSLTCICHTAHGIHRPRACTTVATSVCQSSVILSLNSTLAFVIKTDG